MLLNVIGLGKIGSALVQGMLEAKTFSPSEIIGSDINVQTMDKNPQFWGIKTINENSLGVKAADIILLAVKPQVIAKVLEEIKSELEHKLIISIAAGISIDYLKQKLPASARIIRAMPNTPALVKEGITAIAGDDKVSKEDIKLVEKILNSVGKVVQVEEELMDAVTGLSGSGPAYIYLIIEALADGGVLTGIPRDLSLSLAAQTVLGAAKMVLQSGKHPGELKDMVTSPGGTSIKGIEILEKHGVRGTLITAVKEATKRSKELNQNKS